MTAQSLEPSEEAAVEPVAPAKRGVIVVHFTSLANYSNVRDCVQSILSPGSLGALPEVEGAQAVNLLVGQHRQPPTGGAER